MLATVFTQSVPNPSGFALECQLDKGLPAKEDYMALRRLEDQRFADRAGADKLVWLDHPEAPHRGYESAPALFNGLLPEDEVWTGVAKDLDLLISRYEPDIIFLPQALGDHVDHLQVVRAALCVIPPERIAWYRDVPYAIRNPVARPSSLVPKDTLETGLDVSDFLETKLDAAAAYATQLEFQFGGEEKMRETLSRFAGQEARWTGRPGSSETFLTSGHLPL